MLLPLMVFVLVVSAIMGLYAAATRVPGLLARRRLDQRLRDVSMAVPAPRRRRPTRSSSRHLGARCRRSIACSRSRGWDRGWRG
jgi:hypothetical protein